MPVAPGKGFALQLTSHDARGWRATFYTTGDGPFADERDRHRMGADAPAGGAAGGEDGGAVTHTTREEVLDVASCGYSQEDVGVIP
jgi:hypothetical protein